jgi:hypothetical protein
LKGLGLGESDLSTGALARREAAGEGAGEGATGVLAVVRPLGVVTFLLEPGVRGRPAPGAGLGAGRPVGSGPGVLPALLGGADRDLLTEAREGVGMRV